jgi:hypothetical protein
MDAALAIELADVLTRAGAGHLPAVLKLLGAASANSAILGQRAEAAYDAATQGLPGEAGWSECKAAAVGRILTRAARPRRNRTG